MTKRLMTGCMERERERRWWRKETYSKVVSRVTGYTLSFAGIIIKIMARGVMQQDNWEWGRQRERDSWKIFSIVTRRFLFFGTHHWSLKSGFFFVVFLIFFFHQTIFCFHEISEHYGCPLWIVASHRIYVCLGSLCLWVCNAFRRAHWSVATFGILSPAQAYQMVGELSIVEVQRSTYLWCIQAACENWMQFEGGCDEIPREKRANILFFFVNTRYWIGGVTVWCL